MTKHALCRCGNVLPKVAENEVPYEFCSQRCRIEAAAPAMYEALTEIVRWFDLIKNSHPEAAKLINLKINDARAAIAAAEGRG